MREASVVGWVLAWFGNGRRQLSCSREAWAEGRWDEAERWAMRAARSGYSDANVLLASLYIERNAPGDRRRAFERSQAAAESGNAAGMQVLGWCFEQGVGVDVNLESARRWYRAAADQGRVDCQVAVARMLFDGIGGPRDEQAALRYAELARSAGAKEAEELSRRITPNS